MAAYEPDAPSRLNVFSFYTPADPNLRGTPAFIYLQSCIGRAVEHALKSGTPADLVRARFSQNQTHFDAVLGTLDAVFQLGDHQPKAAMRSGDLAAASLHVAQQQAPRSPTHLFQRPTTFAPAQNHRGLKAPALLDPSLPQQTASVTAVANGGNAADSLRIGDNFPDTPHFSLENSDGLRNRERHLEAVAAQRLLIDEDRRAANSSMVGDWLENVIQVQNVIQVENVHQIPVNHAHQSAQSDMDTQDDIELPDTRSNPNKRRRIFGNQADGTAVHPSGLEDPTANSLPFRTKSKSESPPRSEFHP